MYKVLKDELRKLKRGSPSIKEGDIAEVVISGVKNKQKKFSINMKKKDGFTESEKQKIFVFLTTVPPKDSRYLGTINQLFEWVEEEQKVKHKSISRFGQLLFAEMQFGKITPRDLFDLLNKKMASEGTETPNTDAVSMVTIYKWIKGERTAPEPQFIIPLCKILDITPEYLLGNDEMKMETFTASSLLKSDIEDPFLRKILNREHPTREDIILDCLLEPLIYDEEDNEDLDLREFFAKSDTFRQSVKDYLIKFYELDFHNKMKQALDFHYNGTSKALTQLGNPDTFSSKILSINSNQNESDFMKDLKVSVLDSYRKDHHLWSGYMEKSIESLSKSDLEEIEESTRDCDLIVPKKYGKLNIYQKAALLRRLSPEERYDLKIQGIEEMIKDTLKEAEDRAKYLSDKLGISITQK